MKRQLLSAVVVAASCVTALQLSSTEESLITLPEDPFTFPPQMVMTSTMHTFNVTPAGSNDDDILTSITYDAAPCQDYTFTAMNLPFEICGNNVNKPGCHPSYQFNVTFTPKNIGMSSCVFDLNYDNAGSGSAGSGLGCAAPVLSGPNGIYLHVSGNGVGPPYAMNVSPTQLDFGSVTLNVPSMPQTITVTNVGTNALNVSETLVNTSEYNIPSAGFVLAAPPASMSSRNIMVSCVPTTTGPHDASVTFTTPPGQGNIMKPVMLTCDGVNTTLSESPNPIAFGDRFIGVGAAQPITLSNAGSGVPIMITSIALGASSSSDLSLTPAVPAGFTLNPGANAMPVTVNYSAATQRAPGPLGTLVVTSSSGNLTYPITGGAEPGSIASNPASIDFGPVCIGGMVQKDLSLYASGDADVVMSGVNDPGAPFSASQASGTLRGHHNGEVAITATVAPAVGAMLGDRMGELDITTNLPAPDTVYKVPLSAKVLPMGIAPTPGELHFGMTAVDVPTSGKMVQLTNCSGSPLTLSGAHITGDPSEFALVSTTDAAGSPATFPFDLADHTSATFLLIMAPHSIGHKTASLEIDYTGSSALVPLDGDAGSTNQRETYYGCAVGGGGAAWPIGFVLLALRRRRR